MQKPKEVVVGTYWEMVSEGTRRRRKRTNATFMYIPILETLENILNDEEHYREVHYQCLILNL